MTQDNDEMTLTVEQAAVSRDFVGPMGATLAAIEEICSVSLNLRGDQMMISGSKEDIKSAQILVQTLFDKLMREGELDPEDVYVAAASLENQSKAGTSSLKPENTQNENAQIFGITPKNEAQREFLEALSTQELIFGIGPAGTGKTYLAVAAGVAFLKSKHVERLVITRPAVEAGERLGYLPGDLKEKVDPYLQPIWDSLNELMGQAQVENRRERGIIELAPLAYMRGRTLKNAMIILDEAQNATRMQMRMALTRIGYGSVMAVTGDPSQTDLPPSQSGGLANAAQILKSVKGVSINHFSDKDVVRRRLVADIVNRYSEYDRREKQKTAR